jgi:thiosulfate/3-mercaptopyruvate sulfurtransferase
VAGDRFERVRFIVLFLAPAVVTSICVGPLPAKNARAKRAVGAQHDASQWRPEQTVEPAALVKEISKPGPHHPIVVCVGFRTLYEGAHVPGASFDGPAMNAAGLADLKKWAQNLPRSANIVIYCGCCPLAHCPNVRPAFAALHSMGFTHLRLLLLPQDFAHNWVDAGYAISKGK